MNPHLAENIIFLRKRILLTRQEMAALLGVKMKVLTAWEESSSEPSLKNLESIADLFNVSIDDLVKIKHK